MQETWVQSLVQEDSTCPWVAKPIHHNYWSPRDQKPQLDNSSNSPQQESNASPSTAKSNKHFFFKSLLVCFLRPGYLTSIHIYGFSHSSTFIFPLFPYFSFCSLVPCIPLFRIYSYQTIRISFLQKTQISYSMPRKGQSFLSLTDTSVQYNLHLPSSGCPPSSLSPDMCS